MSHRLQYFSSHRLQPYYIWWTSSHCAQHIIIWQHVVIYNNVENIFFLLMFSILVALFVDQKCQIPWCPIENLASNALRCLEARWYNVGIWCLSKRSLLSMYMPNTFIHSTDWVVWLQIDGLVHDCTISIADALNILQYCTKPSTICIVSLIIKGIQFKEPIIHQYIKEERPLSRHCQQQCVREVIESFAQIH